MEPERQGIQAVALLLGLYDPTGQGAHASREVAFTLLPNFPSGQPVQTLAPA